MYVIQNIFWYVINPKERNIQALRLDDIQFALRTDYILAKARLHTNPSDWIKKEKLFRASLFLGTDTQNGTGLKPDFLTFSLLKAIYHRK